MCPACDERDPLPGEEDYASCFFCAFTDGPSTGGPDGGPNGESRGGARSSLRAGPAHPPVMSSSTRVKPGVPTGGQFAAATKRESNLSLDSGPADALDSPAVPAADPAADTPMPGFPDRRAFAAQFPNRAQRTDRLNEAYYDMAAAARTYTPERLGAARLAMRDTLAFHGRFVSLPEDDGEAEALVADAAKSDQKVLEAITRVGTLEDFEARSFGGRVAGALYDIEVEERDDKAAHAAAMSLHAIGDDKEPTWLGEEPVDDFTW